MHRPIQDFYPDDIAICYGCGRNNPHGLHLQTFWDGGEGICRFTPRPMHTAFPGVVYGGLLAALIDCHSIGTAVAAMYDMEERPPDSDPYITCVTATLNVTYHKPTPMGQPLLLRARVKELSERKAHLHTVVYVGELETVSADVIAVRVKERRLAHGATELEK
jgi:acyl-coenzyme A thioesterase PaaI-like protein